MTASGASKADKGLYLMFGALQTEEDDDPVDFDSA